MFKNKATRYIVASIFLVILAIAMLVSYKVGYIQYQEIGKEYLKVFNTNVIEKVSIAAITFICIYLIILVTNHNIKKGLEYYFKKEDKPMPKLWNNSLAIIISAVFAIIFAQYLQGSFLTLLNMPLFGKNDPINHIDYSFFVIALPIIQILFKLILAFLIFLLFYIAVYYIVISNKYLEGIDFEEFKSSKLVNQLLTVIIFIVVLIATYSFITSTDILVGDMLKKETVSGMYLTGAGFSDMNVRLWTNRILPFVLLFALYLFVKGIKKQNSKLILNSLLLVPIYIVCMFIVITVVDYVFLRGNELEREKTYIQENIQSTKYGFGLDIETKNIDNVNKLTIDQINSEKENLSKFPIITSDIVKEANLADKDKKEEKLYTNDDPELKKDDNEYVYFSPREVNKKKEKIQLADKTYDFTHGNFGIVTKSNVVDKNGYLINYDDNFKDQHFKGVTITKPQIYYGLETTTPVVINKEGQKEIDYPTGIDSYNFGQYEGQGGIHLGFMDRVLMSFQMKDPAILFDKSYTNDSKVLLNRQITQRASKIFGDKLKLDKNPYMIVSKDGHLKWVIDGYTLSSRFPYSQKIPIDGKNGGKDRINYIRNSIKIIVDAYDGTVTFYQTDKQDPFVYIINKTYKGIIKDIDTLDPFEKEQFKYPQYLYDIQARVLEIYHNVQIDTLYRSEDLWQISAIKIDDRNKDHFTPSMYTMVKDGDQDKIGLVSIFTPKQRQNITAYTVGTTQDGQNKLKLYRFNKNENALSLNFIKEKIQEDKNISQELSKLNTLGTKVFTKSYIVPFANTMLYVQPVYKIFVNDQIPQPTLKKVIVVNGNNVGIGDDLVQAINSMFLEGAISIDVTDPQNNEILIDAIIKQNNDLKASLETNDLEYIGKDMKKLTNLIDQLAQNQKEEKIQAKEKEKQQQKDQAKQNKETSKDKNTDQVENAA